jgi:UDP-N-acetylmuramoyl-L-alanyl-D-glutamate--2,6-diaminopimelate ligase
VRILDRTDAIRHAIFHAQEGDVIILAGKGHENYQIFNGKTIHYDEREVVADILVQKAARKEKQAKPKDQAQPEEQD